MECTPFGSQRGGFCAQVMDQCGLVVRPVIDGSVIGTPSPCRSRSCGLRGAWYLIPGLRGTCQVGDFAAYLTSFSRFLGPSSRLQFYLFDAKMTVSWLRRLHSHRSESTNDIAQATSSALPLENTTATFEPNTKAPAIDVEASAASVHDDDKIRPNEDAQAGVKAAEAVTISWSKKALIAAFAK